MQSKFLQSEAVDCNQYNLLEKTMRKYDYQQIGFVLTSSMTVVAIHLIAPVIVMMQVVSMI